MLKISIFEILKYYALKKIDIFNITNSDFWKILSHILVEHPKV